jgi:hypothetical protein
VHGGQACQIICRSGRPPCTKSARREICGRGRLAEER